MQLVPSRFRDISFLLDVLTARTMKRVVAALLWAAYKVNFPGRHSEETPSCYSLLKPRKSVLSDSVETREL
jgi:hypothetical protein